MKIGVILPSGVPGVDGPLLQQWCRLADEGPFSSLAVPDRLVYGNLDPLQVLSFAAAATRRVQLVTCILIAPLRPAPLFAKEVATLAALAPGRLTLGVGVGARPYDYAEAGADWNERVRQMGKHLEYLDRLRQRDDEQALGPSLGELEILVGGARSQALGWLVRHGAGYISGGIKPEFFGYEVAATRGAWKQAGKTGEPRIVAGTWCASEERYDRAAAHLDHYLSKGGPPDFIRDEIRRGEEGVRQAIEEFGAHGMDEIVFFPQVSDVAELEWLAGVVADVAEPAAL